MVLYADQVEPELVGLHRQVEGVIGLRGVGRYEDTELNRPSVVHVYRLEETRQDAYFSRPPLRSTARCHT